MSRQPKWNFHIVRGKKVGKMHPHFSHLFKLQYNAQIINISVKSEGNAQGQQQEVARLPLCARLH